MLVLVASWAIAAAGGMPSAQAQGACPTISASGTSTTLTGATGTGCTVTAANVTITLDRTAVLTSSTGAALQYIQSSATGALVTNGNVIVNNGAIGSASQATSILTKYMPSGTLRIENNGTIINTITQSIPDTVLTQIGAGGTFTINNNAGGVIRTSNGSSSGTIVNDISQNNISTNMFLRNSGTITGSLSLGQSQDTVMNSGLIDGNIDFGAAGARKGALALRPGWQITGIVTSQGTTLASIGIRAPATLSLSGAGTSTFDSSQIGSITSGLKFQGFGGFVKEGPSTWTLTGTMNASYLPANNVAPAWWVAEGRMVASVESLGWNVTFGDRALVESATGFAAGNVTTVGGVTTGTGGDPDFLPIAGGSATLEFNQATNATFAKTITQCNAVGDFSGNCAVPIVGNVIKSGAGTLTLSGVNTYSGGTTLAGGALAVAADSALGASSGGLNFTGGTLSISADLSTARAVTLGAGGGTIDTAGRQLTLSGGASGTGGLTKIGSGTLILSGTNTFAGTSDVQAGTLTLSGGAAIADTAAVTVASAGTLNLATNETVGSLVSAGTIDGAGRTLTASTYTFDGGTVNANLGTGALTQRTGTTTLNGTSAASSVAVTGGTLLMGAASRLSSSVALTAGGGTLDLGGFGQAVASTMLSGGTIANGTLTSTAGYDARSGSVTAVLAGTGGLIKTTTGTVTLSGASTYAGATDVQAGTLVLSGGAAVADTGAVTVAAAGTLSLATSETVASLVSAGTIDGAGRTLTAATYTLDGGTVNANLGTGALTQRAGSTTLNGTSAAGTVSVVGGTLLLGGNDRLSTAAGLTMTGGTLNLGGFGQTVATAVLTGGTVTNGTLTSTATFDVRGGSIGATLAGTGGLTKTGTGTLVLSGTNTFTGVTDIQAGTLSVTGGSAIGDGSSVTVRAGATLNLVGDETVASLVSAGTVDGAGRTLTAASYTFDGGTVNANLGAGSLTQRSGSTTLKGSASAGTVVVDGGTLLLAATDRLSAAAAITLNSGTLDLNGWNTSSGSLAGGAGATVALGAGTLTTGGNGSSTGFAGTISGTGGLTKTGAGTLTLSGTNGFTGTTNVEAGTLALAGGTALGDTGAVTVGAAGTLDLGASETVGSLVSAGTISGAGRTLTAATYALDGGTVNANLGTGALTQRAGTTTLNGTAAAARASVDGGSLVLGAANRLSVTSAVTVNGGTLNLNGWNQEVGSLAGGAGGTVALGGGTLTTGNSGASTVFAGAISGTGGLVKSGTGTLVLSGTNIYTGTTTVAGGTLQVGNGGTTGSLGSGNIVNNGTLSFNRTDSVTFANTVSGTGGLVQAGTGTTNLTGTHTYSGPTAVLAGRLSVNGSIASDTTVAAAGTIGGNGSIAGLVTVNGTAAPGNSIGTLTVNGNYVQNAGSVYQVEINPAGQADRIQVNGVATINGGTVQILPSTPTGYHNTTYTILSATGGVVGTFASTSLASDFAFMRPSLSYDSGNVYLNLTVSFSAGPLTVNQRAPARALDVGAPTATGDFDTVVTALAALNSQQGLAALNAIGGEPLASNGTANFASSLLYMDTVGRQIAAVRGGDASGRTSVAQACLAACEDAAAASTYRVWWTAVGGTGSVLGDGNASTLTYNLGGFAGGADRRFLPGFLAGLSFGATAGNQWVSGFPGTAGNTSYQASLYASFGDGPFYLDALAGYAYGSNQVARTILIPGLQPRTARSSAGANQLFGQAETGYRFDLWQPAAATLTPFLRFQAASLSQDGFSEWGANSLNLNVAGQSLGSIRTVLGAQADAAVDLGWRERLALQFRLGWAHEYADTTRPMTASFAGVPGASFTVYGAQPQRDSVTLGLAANTALNDSTSIYLRYDGEVGSGFARHGLGLGMQIRW